MKWLTVALCLVAILACTTNTMAARCSGIAEPSRVFCDDFDRWCTDIGADPQEACAIGSPVDTTGFYAFWPQSDGTCSPNSPHQLKQDPMWKPDGYAPIVRQNEDIMRVTRHVHDMTAEIEANTRNASGHGAVNGSGTIYSSRDTGNYVDPETMPDVLKGQFFFHTSSNPGAAGNFTAYVELNLDDDRAPTDFTRFNCYPEAQGPYQVLETTDGQPHASFAFGMIAIMDPFPCDVEVGRRPSSEVAVVYDGLDWHMLKFEGVCGLHSIVSPTGLCKGGSTHGATCMIDADCTDGAFDLPNEWESFGNWKNWEKFYFYIGTDYIEVRLYNGRADLWHSGEGICLYDVCIGGDRHDGGCATDDDCTTGPSRIAQPYFVARVPRQYTGPFNSIATGAGKGLDVTTPTCEEMYGLRCVGGPNTGSLCTTAADCPASVPGVDEECLETIMGNRNNAFEDEFVIYDGVFQASGTQGACCKPDATCEETDQPNCVDPEGLNGLWMGGGTTCAETMCCHTPWADADGDTDVDQVDFGIFQACFSGEGNAYEDGCECFNRDGPTDTDIDGDDFIDFSECWSGPKVPWSATPNCPGTW